MLYQRPSLACTCVSLGTSVSCTSLASWTSRSYLRFVVKWPSGRPTSLAARLTIRVACGVNRLTRQVVVQEDRGNLAAVQEVLHVAVGLRQFLDLHLQLGVDRLHFFVE